MDFFNLNLAELSLKSIKKCGIDYKCTAALTLKLSRAKFACRII
jgi:hypothetical protein